MMNNKLKNILIVVCIVVAMLATSLYTFNAGRNSVLKQNQDYVKSVVSEKEIKFFDEKTANTLGEIYNAIGSEYYKDVDNDTLNEGILKGVVESLEDPYSEYFNEEEYKEFNQSSEGKYSGVGIVVSPGEDGFITVVSTIKDTPAHKAGIKSDDKIIKVDGVEYTADKMNEAVKVMRGKEGTKVKLEILRKTSSKMETLTFELTRQTIKLNTAEGELLKDNIGYISVSEFDEPTYNDFVKVYKELKNKGMKKLIIDLRGNPGGLLNVCAELADFFLDKGTIVYTSDKNGNKEYLYSDDAAEDIPLVVLVNKGSASASEIVTGAFKDRGRAKIVGTQTFGKGIVQRIFPLSSGRAVKLTISEYYTPNGNNIHGTGIEPDYVVELPEDIKGIGVKHLKEDTQLQKAIELLK